MRRRWGRVAAGMGAAVIGMWVFAALYITAGSKEEVLMVARDVPKFEAITEDDLDVAQVSMDPGPNSIPASEVDDYIGRIPDVPLVEGSILTEEHFLPEDAEVLSPGEAVIAAQLSESEFPSSGARAGSLVEVVIRPADTSQEVTSVSGWLLEVGEADEHNRERAVSVVVSGDSAAVSAAAADDRISIVVLET